MNDKLYAYGIFGAIVVIILAIAGIFAWPLCCIWAVNTLFGMGIAYTWKTWLAALVINMALVRTIKVNK